MSFNTQSWNQAEESLLLRLCEQTGSVAGKNAFLGELPAVPNVWAINTGPFQNIESLWCPNVTTVCMRALIDGQFAKRSDAQALVMKIIAQGEQRDIENVALFRVTGDVQIQLEAIPIANSDTKILLFTVQLACELVFTTVADAPAD